MSIFHLDQKTKSNMYTSRQKVLNHLKKKRSASAREIARALRMSAPNVRHHLSILCSDGRVEMTALHNREGRGRPEKLYSVSQTALQDNLSVLTDALLKEKFDAVKIGKRIAQSHAQADPAANQPMTRRLAGLVLKLNEMHYQAHWEAGADGPRVFLGRCPYSKVIEGHPELCKMDAAMLEEALERSVARLVKSEVVLHGLCPFVFVVK